MFVFGVFFTNLEREFVPSFVLITITRLDYYFQSLQRLSIRIESSSSCARCPSQISALLPITCFDKAARYRDGKYLTTHCSSTSLLHGCSKNKRWVIIMSSYDFRVGGNGDLFSSTN